MSYRQALSNGHETSGIKIIRHHKQWKTLMQYFIFYTIYSDFNVCEEKPRCNRCVHVIWNKISPRWFLTAWKTNICLRIIHLLLYNIFDEMIFWTIRCISLRFLHYISTCCIDMMVFFFYITLSSWTPLELT